MMKNTLHTPNTDSREIALCTPQSIDEVIRVVESAIQTGLEAEPLSNIFDPLPSYVPSQKISMQPPAYTPPSPPLTIQRSNSASISSVPSENLSFANSSIKLSEILNHWWMTEKTYIIELSIFQELLLRGALMSQLNVSSLETISRCISIFITASSSIINTFEMYIPQHLLHKTLMNTIPMFTDTILESFELYISVYTLKLDDQFLSPDNHKWLTIALSNCGILQSTSTKKCQWLLSSPLHRVKIYTRIFRKFLRALADADDELSEQFSYAHQCFHLLLSKARGHIKMIREGIGQTPSAPNNMDMLHNLTCSVRQVEKELDVSKMRDLFTLEPKKYILDLQPPQLPFVRSIIARSNFFLKMIHSITGEIIQKYIELILLTDVILFLDIEVPKYKFLMFQPFLTRIFKVIETDDEQTFILSIYEREQIYLTAASKKLKKLWINLLSSSRAVQSINYSTFKLSPVGNPVIPKDTGNFPTIFDEMNHRLSSDLTPFKKILLPSRSLKSQNQDKSHTKNQLSITSEKNNHVIENVELKSTNTKERNYQSIPASQPHLNTYNVLVAHQNKSESTISKSAEYMQKIISRPTFDQSGLNTHLFPQPPDRTSNGIFSFPDKNSRPNNYSNSYIFSRTSKIRLETLPEENESFIDVPKSPDIDNKKTDEQESSEHSTYSTELGPDSISEATSTSYLINENNSISSSKSSNSNVDSKENEFKQLSSSYKDYITQSATDSDVSISSKSTRSSGKTKTESDTTSSTEEQTSSDINLNTSQISTAPQLPMPDLGRISLTSMIFNDSVLGFSYSDPNATKTSETSSNKNNSDHTEILYRNSKLINKLPPSLSSENSEILFCEKATVFFWNSTFWKNVFDIEEKVFLIIKYTCTTDMFTLEICNLSSQEIIVCGELQKYSTIVRQSKQEISIACFIQDRISYILSKFKSDSNADLFYIVSYRIINRDNPWVLQIFRNHESTNYECNSSNRPLNTTPKPTDSSKSSNKKAGLILSKSKAKVFIQTSPEQWKYLGSGILWITTLDSDSKKNVLVAKKTNQPNKSSTILNGVVSKSDYQQSGRSSIFMRCFDELSNKTISYTIKVKNGKQAKSIINVLNA
ncbi:hypothetical protein PNEG_03372 [Pneumocystis murina B123]|uniref:DH domain-containing protein n=1 Tax=Pneumocystis murina (strain B123) TaxID=1069680 RepID=M7NLX7_PNEMU|nr:hypothetical protein PNEG_03372 [Pneumocystis murina B123]EMR08202.1 hypothetical protein PNEG_03372 [Pneumocystis murina B123]